MANTYEFIASSTVGSGGAASITFSSIAANWTDLKLVCSARSNSGSGAVEAIVLTINSGSSYSAIYLQGNGSSAASGTFAQFAGQIADTGATANTFSNFEIYIPNYLSSNQKSYSVDTVSENNAASGYDTLIAGLWTGTSAITSLSIARYSGGSFVQYSTAYLYGIKNS